MHISATLLPVFGGLTGTARGNHGDPTALLPYFFWPPSRIIMRSAINDGLLRTFTMAGLYFDEFTVGQKFQHPITRTITEADNVWFSTLTHNPAPLHIDAEYCKTTEFGRRLVNSCLTLGFMVGISVGDTTLGTTVANLGWDEVRFPRPLFHGDTIHVESEVLELRKSKSRPQNGIVVFSHRAFNQRDELVGECKRSALMHKSPG